MYSCIRTSYSSKNWRAACTSGAWFFVQKVRKVHAFSVFSAIASSACIACTHRTVLINTSTNTNTNANAKTSSLVSLPYVK